ncbi:MAG TPA: pyruvate carboxylase subunit B [Deltaproteobacteria bacterium]|nr:pyruvate carboxylase subunit B [Deltaproteobacteria bacterium]
MRHGGLTAGLLDGPVVKATNPVKVQDVTMRDAHQSLFATRCRTDDFIPIAELMDSAGFHSLEVWGGATFDTMHRFLGEDPWERIRTMKKHIRKTPLSMLLRGQNLVGYRNYPDDVAEAFVDRACANGMDIFRVFDALNDFRNFETVVRVIKDRGRHFQGAICYSLTESRMGGEVYNLEYYLNKARELEALGADSICIKDMAGLIAPYDAYALVKALKETVSVPIHLHSHFTSGMADMSLLKAIEAGVDIVDTCLSTWAYRTSHPAVEPLVAALRHTSRDTGLDIELLARLSGHLETISPRYRHLMDERMSPIDINVLLHQTPGGMLSNLVIQLKEMDALDRLDEVFRQLPIVRRELGQVPLVTPTSQIVGIQTVNNVLFDTPGERYRMITEQVKDLCYGLYGRTASPIDPGVQKKALRDYPRGMEPITARPADVLEPELDKARKETEGLAKGMDDILICALYPTTGKRFLRWKYGLEPVPEEVKPKTLEMVQSDDERAKKAREGRPTDKPAPSVRGAEARTFRIHMNGDSFDVSVEQIGGEPLFPPTKTSARKTTLDLCRPQARGALNYAPSRPVMEERPAKTAPQEDSSGQTPVLTPMPGMVVSYRVREGDRVSRGDVVAVLEAMKMENFITAPVDGTVRRITLGEGANAKKGDVLALIA